jgi:hypothetical protein
MDGPVIWADKAIGWRLYMAHSYSFMKGSMATDHSNEYNPGFGN